ncbi:MAG: hypothetical protein JOY71_29530 [Acetobacteraceae bacterium]|nr:hypothetical protein [Acetobacteraceae bacterium]
MMVFGPAFALEELLGRWRKRSRKLISGAQLSFRCNIRWKNLLESVPQANLMAQFRRYIKL